ncbi:helix-turn-helix transcriptional regulator [Bacillaceae bacterium S4-13-58]
MPEEAIKHIIGARIRYLRKEKKLTQEELAHLSSIHPTYIGQLERGEKNPTIETIDRIARSLEISLSELFSFQSLNKEQQDIQMQKLIDYAQQLDDKERRMVLKIIEVFIEWEKRMDAMED